MSHLATGDTATVVDDAMQRLVHAMTGSNDRAATSLAHRIAGSQFGSSQDDGSSKQQLHHHAVDLSSTWRRISRKAPDANCRADVEEMYRRLERQCRDDPKAQQLPPKILLVLTKLMGKHMVLPKPSTPFVPTSQDDKTNVSEPMKDRDLSSYQSRPTSYVAPTPTQRQPQPVPPTQRQPQPPTDRISMEREIKDERKELEKEESLLLRECLYSLQGIDGERIRYYHKDLHNGENRDSLSSYDGVRVRSPALSHSLLYSGRVLETRLGSGAIDALRINGEAGWLYCLIQSYIHQVQQDESRGVVARAFAETLGDELREYHSLLAQYESQLPSLSLRQLLVDIRMPTSRLRILALVADGVRHLSGGHLLRALYQHGLHGDTRHAKLVQNILCAASRPWFDILYTWTTQGVLSDPHGEFFVTERPDVDNKHLWREKYCINKDQIPEGILEKGLVGPAFNVGKGINFIRRCLLDGKWTMDLAIYDDDDTADIGLNTDLGYQYRPYSDSNASLQHTLSRAATLVHSHILRTLREENHMMQHLFALKQFLFLGQGDFFSALMDGLHSEFREQPGVAGIYKHSLLAIVESALRSTNAKYLQSYVLDRLQVELLLDPDDSAHGLFGPSKQNDNGDKRTVWDIFMLDYQVPDPLVAIVHPGVLEKYKMVFSLLFRLRRVEFMLNYTWRQSATLQHALQTYGQYNGIDIGTSSAYAAASFLLRKISILRQNMMHLIVNLKSYFMFEVLEGGWRRLESDMEVAETLDEVIESHDRYINGIVRKSLLPTDNMNDIAQQKLAQQVQTLLQVTGEFCELQEKVFHESLLLADIASRKRMEANQRANQGRWGFDSEREITEEENFFGLADNDKMQAVTRISRLYNDNALELLRVLGDKVNANTEDDFGEEEEDNSILDLDEPEQYGLAPKRRRPKVLSGDDLDPQRFLIAQLDHNDFYGGQGLRHHL